MEKSEDVIFQAQGGMLTCDEAAEKIARLYARREEKLLAALTAQGIDLTLILTPDTFELY